MDDNIIFGNTTLTPSVVNALSGLSKSNETKLTSPNIVDQQSQLPEPSTIRSQPNFSAQSALNQLGEAFSFSKPSEPIMYESATNTNMLPQLNNSATWNAVTKPITEQVKTQANQIGLDDVRAISMAHKENILNEANQNRDLREQKNKVIDEYYNSFGYKMSESVPILGQAFNLLSGNVARTNDKLAALDERIKVNEEQMADDALAFGTAQKLAAGVVEFDDERAALLQQQLKSQREVTRYSVSKGSSSGGGSGGGSGRGGSAKPWQVDFISNNKTMDSYNPIVTMNHGALSTDSNYNAAKELEAVTLSYGNAGASAEAQAGNKQVAEYQKSFMKTAIEANGGDTAIPLLEDMRANGMITPNRLAEAGTWVASNGDINVSEESLKNPKGKMAQELKGQVEAQVTRAIQNIDEDTFNRIDKIVFKESGKHLDRYNLNDASWLMKLQASNTKLQDEMVKQGINLIDSGSIFKQAVMEKAPAYFWSMTDEFTEMQAARLSSLGRNEASVVNIARKAYERNLDRNKEDNNVAIKPKALYLIDVAGKAQKGELNGIRLNNEQFRRFSDLLFSPQALDNYGQMIVERSSRDDLRTQTIGAVIPDQQVINAIKRNLNNAYRSYYSQQRGG